MGSPFSPERVAFVVTCEHGGNRVPSRYRDLFRPHIRLLRGHRGYDAGARELARHLGRALAAPCFVASTTRLLVDLNRSVGNRNLFSAMTRPLDATTRQEILRRYYHPHRAAVESAVAEGMARGRRVVHIAVHSFVPVLDGVERTCDLSLLYDPRRNAERTLSAAWLEELRTAFPGLRLRRNYPYRGIADGLTAYLRKRFPPSRYAGIELEVNQGLIAVGGTRWNRIRKAIPETLKASLLAD